MADYKYIAKPTDQADDYSKITVVPKTVQGLIDLQKKTGGRFWFKLQANGKIADYSYCNYIYGTGTSANKLKEWTTQTKDHAKGAYATEKQVYGQVVVE